MEDDKIIALYWARKEEAISETDRKYGSYCRSISFRILNDKEDSEECVNDTWLHTWNAIPPGKPEFLAGFLGKFLLRGGGSGMRLYLRCLLTVSAGHLIGSVVIKTLGLYYYYGSPLLFTFSVRLGIYAVTAVIESVILYILYTQKIIAKFRPRRTAARRQQEEDDQHEL